jgi:hypothetical protein
MGSEILLEGGGAGFGKTGVNDDLHEWFAPNEF